jgi:hypothetical protein
MFNTHKLRDGKFRDQLVERFMDDLDDPTMFNLRVQPISGLI